jgi:hypothetical protein
MMETILVFAILVVLGAFLAYDHVKVLAEFDKLRAEFVAKFETKPTVVVVAAPPTAVEAPKAP